MVRSFEDAEAFDVRVGVVRGKSETSQALMDAYEKTTLVIHCGRFVGCRHCSLTMVEIRSESRLHSIGDIEHGKFGH